ncbi:MAG TPA: glycosyltransferase [Chryseosolibacter sp.]|nr:glycosyltransferase [Chryseosolibacter sp.]
MSTERFHDKPLITVIIPCFNQGRFLADAITSVQRQTYSNVEIVVIDDGSCDDTEKVARSFVNVRYHWQSNAGLSAARNAGIKRSNGSYLVFLDADDVLYPNALEVNLRWLLKEPSWAFVSGGHDKVDEWLYPIEPREEPEGSIRDHYVALLGGNYIGMHAAVMYRRTTFDTFEYDTTLRACEDYDLYLKVAREHPIGNHAVKVAAYRRHGNNMSANALWMLSQVLKVHARQRKNLRTDEERRAWRAGIRTWKQYYAQIIYHDVFCKIGTDESWPSMEAMKVMANCIPFKLKDYVIKKTREDLLAWLKRSLPDRMLRWFHKCGLYTQYTPPLGKIQPGDFDRVTPFSADFGFDRGGPIDRFYIEKFLSENQDRVRGKVLEIGDNAYTMKFGGNRVLQSDILHVDHSNTRATYIGDITHVPQIPTAEFDCIIFTQTLHLIYDFKSALKTCYRILKPGGCLLLTVPGISHIDKGEWRDYWLWSFTDTAIRKLMAETFNGSKVDVRTYGNVYVAAAFLYGVGLAEFRKEYLFHHDNSYQVIISAAAVKA